MINHITNFIQIELELADLCHEYQSEHDMNGVNYYYPLCWFCQGRNLESFEKHLKIVQMITET